MKRKKFVEKIFFNKKIVGFTIIMYWLAFNFLETCSQLVYVSYIHLGRYASDEAKLVYSVKGKKHFILP